ncbi:hypothetical protein RchiOBHm_Chr7g0211401 [Rosa chinensis]|uniref:Uncharacterized protein n=1 Tax=Rosa chinensis TaxID=74649 RepID=A0A2P6PAG5_ROSCH|nr:hypothetical protein RchiOBHm_Chr7g0211401 [Rosa chinensis]
MNFGDPGPLTLPLNTPSSCPNTTLSTRRNQRFYPNSTCIRKELLFQYNHKILEYLGLKNYPFIYQRKSFTNVIP